VFFHGGSLADLLDAAIGFGRSDRCPERSIWLKKTPDQRTAQTKEFAHLDQLNPEQGREVGKELGSRMKVVKRLFYR
jgi:hypothetical protein